MINTLVLNTFMKTLNEIATLRPPRAERDTSTYTENNQPEGRMSETEQKLTGPLIRRSFVWIVGPCRYPRWSQVLLGGTHHGLGCPGGRYLGGGGGGGLGVNFDA